MIFVAEILQQHLYDHTYHVHIIIYTKSSFGLVAPAHILYRIFFQVPSTVCQISIARYNIVLLTFSVNDMNYPPQTPSNSSQKYPNI